MIKQPHIMFNSNLNKLVIRRHKMHGKRNILSQPWNSSAYSFERIAEENKEEE